MEELEEQLSRSRQAEDENRAAARQIEQTLAEQERARLQQQAHEVSFLLFSPSELGYFSVICTLTK